MPVLVVYASRHGSTREIAERIAAKLTEEGRPAQARPVQEASGLEGYDAFVIGSATYAVHWMDEALAFVKANGAVLARQPVWLFSSGPLGDQAQDAEGHDLATVAGRRRSPGSNRSCKPGTIASSSAPSTLTRLDLPSGRSANCRPPEPGYRRGTSGTGTR